MGLINKKYTKGAILSTFVKGITILEWMDSKVECYYCSECKK
ncbi:hypothetical protein [Terrisporobacter glycolicus]